MEIMHTSNSTNQTKAVSAQLKDWDLDPPIERNLNFPPPKNNNLNMPPSSWHSVIPLNGITSTSNGYHSKDFKCNSEPVENYTLASAFVDRGNKSNDKFSSIKENELITLKKPNGTISKIKTNRKPKGKAPHKKPKFSQPKQKRFVTLPIKNTSNATDQNILKSVKTYAKKVASSSSTINVEDKHLENSSNNSRHAVDLQIESDETLKVNGDVDTRESTLKNDVKHCLFMDEEPLPGIIEKLSDYSNTTAVGESPNFVSQLQVATHSGYQRTRKNLKNRVVGKIKPNSDIEKFPTKNSNKKVKTVQNALNLQTSPLPVLSNSCEKIEKSKINKKKPYVCSKTSKPISVQTSLSPKEIEVGTFNSPLKQIPRKQLTVVQKLSVKQPKRSKRIPKKQAGNSKITSIARNALLFDIVGSCTSDMSGCETNDTHQTFTPVLSKNCVKKKHPKTKNTSVNCTENNLNLSGDKLVDQTLEEVPRLSTKVYSTVSDISYSENKPSTSAPAASVKPSTSGHGASIKGNLKQNVMGKTNKDSCVKNKLSSAQNLSFNSTNCFDDSLNKSFTTYINKFYKWLKEFNITDQRDEAQSKEQTPEIQTLTTYCLDSLMEIQKRVESVKGIGTKQNLIPDREDINIAKNPQYTKRVSSELGVNIMRTELTKKPCTVEPAKECQSSGRVHSGEGNLGKKHHNLNISSDSKLNTAKNNTFMNAQSKTAQHVCSKYRVIYLPLVVCECDSPKSISNECTDESRLLTDINNFSCYIAKEVKRNPEKVSSMVSDSKLKEMCGRIENLVFRKNAEKSSTSSNHRSPIAAMNNEVCNSSIGNIDSETQLSNTIHHSPNAAKNNELSNSSIVSSFNSETQPSNTPQNASLNSNFDLNLGHKIQGQNANFVENTLQQIHFINNTCINVMLQSFLANYDENLHVTVHQFCTVSKTVQLMSEFLSHMDEFNVQSGSQNLLFLFPQNLLDCSLSVVIRDYIKFFLHKIYPPKLKVIKCDSVLKFAKENMSVLEIFAMNCFFKDVELLKPTDFLSRFTCVALTAIYKEHEIQMKSK